MNCSCVWERGQLGAVDCCPCRTRLCLSLSLVKESRKPCIRCSWISWLRKLLWDVDVCVCVCMCVFGWFFSKTNTYFPLSKSVTLQNFKGKQLYVLAFYFSVHFWQTRVTFATSVLYFFSSLKFTLFFRDSVKTSMVTFERWKVESSITSSAN